MPQWNCGCTNCRATRQGKIPVRTQSSVAITDGHGFWLINASPDLPRQMELNPSLHPSRESLRNSPIQGVLLTNADLDHVLGLFTLREGQRLRVYATEAVRAALSDHLGLTDVLNAFCGASWSSPPFELSALRASIEPMTRAVSVSDHYSTDKVSDPGLLFRAIPLTGTPPPFARKTASAGIHSIAYQFLDPKTGGRLVVAPDVAAMTPALENAIRESDAVLFDGTFWSGDELAQVRSGALTAEQMGHVPIRDGSMEWLRKSAARHKIYIHINNTNPILAPGSAERAAVEAAGIVVGYDGLEFEV